VLPDLDNITPQMTSLTIEALKKSSVKICYKCINNVSSQTCVMLFRFVARFYLSPYIQEIFLKKECYNV
jgi:hypothetical protein